MKEEAARAELLQIIGQSQASMHYGKGPMADELIEAINAYQEAVLADEQDKR